MESLVSSRRDISQSAPTQSAANRALAQVAEASPATLFIVRSRSDRPPGKAARSTKGPDHWLRRRADMGPTHVAPHTFPFALACVKRATFASQLCADVQTRSECCPERRRKLARSSSQSLPVLRYTVLVMDLWRHAPMSSPNAAWPTFCSARRRCSRPAIAASPRYVSSAATSPTSTASPPRHRIFSRRSAASIRHRTPTGSRARSHRHLVAASCRTLRAAGEIPPRPLFPHRWIGRQLVTPNAQNLEWPVQLEAHQRPSRERSMTLRSERARRPSRKVSRDCNHVPPPSCGRPAHLPALSCDGVPAPPSGTAHVQRSVTSPRHRWKPRQPLRRAADLAPTELAACA